MRKIARLFTIRTKFEAYLAIFGVAMGATARGAHYLEVYPGFPGYLLYASCCGAVMIVGGLMIDGVTLKQTYCH
ncbi:MULTISPECIES: hypothetical protein [unclassified Sphingobium]|uniref:hypothetical protein n=1 Tax=unclassified Sphingobium TaxID=2611147 RepID=UPI002225A22C|nr:MULTISPECIES: hypothetical protein [unclassified Sphingobium]MCW2366239.1 hypothetical protein [Sphingobium sp. B7D2B]MCW2381642.1 hypothetical protein [Sphingobium sp. B2D3B]MCW2394696.1 hypothetical protein [Sphingobium sp. B8D3B]MCW2398251.1 hypothetical protein [Sphingobium sp. B2D3C]MCW2412359.1 hypothetical protein [Sphingobium sp. B8D3D]